MNRAFRWRVLVFAVSYGNYLRLRKSSLGSGSACARLGQPYRLSGKTTGGPEESDGGAESRGCLPLCLPRLRSPHRAGCHSRAYWTRRPAGANHAERICGCLLRIQLEPACSRTTAFRNFDINSGQFGLNMIELVADKAPDATASRVGYHVALGFGQAMNIVNSTEPGPVPTESNFDQYLKEGYLEYLRP